MAVHKSTRFRDDKAPLKGGNRIRTHPRRPASTEDSSSLLGTLPHEKRRHVPPLQADRVRLESMKARLAVVLAGLATCALALEQQRADRDTDVAATLKGFVVEELWRIHAQMNQFEWARPVHDALKGGTG
jgi:hypothetical protein